MCAHVYICMYPDADAYSESEREREREGERERDRGRERERDRETETGREKHICNTIRPYVLGLWNTRSYRIYIINSSMILYTFSKGI